MFTTLTRCVYRFLSADNHEYRDIYMKDKLFPLLNQPYYVYLYKVYRKYNVFFHSIDIINFKKLKIDF